MKQLQRLFATLLLVCALALNASADGIIQTGTPPPPPAQSTPQNEEETAAERAAETAESETTVFEEAAVAAFDFMCDLLTIF